MGLILVAIIALGLLVCVICLIALLVRAVLNAGRH